MMRSLPVLGLLLCSVGCGQIESMYGVMYGRSLNGIDAFASLLRQEGHRVGVTRKLSPKLMGDYETDVLVLFHDDFGRLSNETREWLESWLGEVEGRQIVLVLRDSDEEIAYWEWVLANDEAELSEDDRALVKARLELAQAALKSLTSEAAPRKWPEWYGTKKGEPWLRVADSVTGPPEWTTDIGLEEGKLDLRFCRRFVPGGGAKSILKAGDDVLVAKRSLRNGSIWMIANGSFLLNHGLVNHEHRKLAGALSRQLGENLHIIFLLGTAITDVDEEDPAFGMFHFLTVGPIPWIAAQLAVLALAFAWLRFPIFGRPQEMETREVYRFGRHVEALGAMLASTGNEKTAQELLERFRSTGVKKSREK